MKPKYSIVRVDRACPSRFECRNFEGHIDYYVCDDRKNNKKQPNCNKCLYGDTKEQLIRKVMTALDIGIKEFDKGNIPRGKEDRRCAEIIVEFLGVEE